MKDWVMRGRPGEPVLEQNAFDTPSVKAYFERVLEPLQAAARCIELLDEPWNDDGASCRA